MSTHKYYKILELPPGASEDAIKKSYRKLSLKHHPDRNNNSEESKRKFQEINEAYERLTSSEEEKINNGFNEAEMFNAENIFNMFQGNMGGFNNIKIQINKPPAIIKNITISLKDAYLGIMLPVEIERSIIEENQKKIEKETIYINIPRGTDKNEIIIYRNKGNITRTGLIGDIKIIINIEENKNFERHGLDLILNKTITLKEALCGCEFYIEHLSGKRYKVTNSATNTILSPNYIKLIPKLGFARKNHVGNLCIKFNIVFPKTLTHDQISQLNNIL